MALRAVLDSLDGLADVIRSEYRVGDDGRYYLDVIDVDSMPAIDGLRQKNRDLLEEKKKLQARLDALGVSTPEEVEELRKRAEQAENSGNPDVDKIREEYEAKLNQLKEQAKRDIERYEEQVKAAQQSAEEEQRAARDYFLDSEITRAVTAADGTPELLNHIVRQNVSVERGDDGRFRLQVLGGDGQPRLKNSSGELMGLDDLVSELKNDPKYGRAFGAPARSGGGANPNGRGGSGGTGVNPFKAETRNITEAMRIAKESPELAARLAHEAGVSLPKV